MKNANIFASLMLFLLSSFTSVKADTFSRQSPIPADFFGLVIHRAHSTTAWPSVPFGTWRLWDSYVKWSDIEPTSGTFNFNVFDKQVDLGLQHGKELIYTFGQTPQWASSMPEEKHAWGMGAGSAPKSMEAWARYVQAVVVRYKGRISGYEVWNEPKYWDEQGQCKGTIFFCGDAKELVDLTRVAAEVISKIDPKAKLSSPGFTDGLRGVDRLDQYLAAGGAKYLKAISFHLYAGKPEDAWTTIAALKFSMAKNGISALPIWNTETGYLVQNDDGNVVAEKSNGGPFSNVYSASQAGGLLARALIVQASGGVDRVVWYAWDSKRMGLLRTKSDVPNELAAAYTAVQHWLVNSTISCESAKGFDSWHCALTRGGRKATVSWRDSNPDSGSVTQLSGSPNGYVAAAKLILAGGVEFSADDGKPW